MSENKEKTAELCLKCHRMYGHTNFNDMCSMCYKETMAEEKREALKQNTIDSKIQEKAIELIQKKTQIEKPEKEQFKIKVKPHLQTKQQKVTQLQNTKKEVESKKQSNLCAQCNRKVRMLGYTCKHCSNQFCKLHRLPEDHGCGVDFISLGRKQLKLDMTAMKKAKVDEI